LERLNIRTDKHRTTLKHNDLAKKMWIYYAWVAESAMRIARRLFWIKLLKMYLP